MYPLDSLLDLVRASRAAFLRLDAAALGQAVARLERAVTVTGGTVQARVELALARALASLLRGEPAEADLGTLASGAAGAGMASAVVEIRAVRALFAIEAGDHAAGLALARRASLMARTEGIPGAEMLANLALARARRYSRQTHLALRIVEALDAVAPPEWRAWLDWERALAGGHLAGGTAWPASGLQALLAAAQAGDRAAFLRHADAVRAATVPRPLRREVAILVAAIDPREPLDEPGEGGVAETAARAELLAWRNGTAALPPAPLHGLAVQPGAAYVVLQPTGESARCLQAGAALLAGPDAVRLRQSRLTHGRVETVLAILALAGPGGLDEATCFARAYGFNYVPALHRGVFDVLLHRVRGAIDGVATIVRTPGRLALVTTRPLLIPDPRTSRSTTDRVLRLLAEQGRATAKEAAARLGVSLRTVQGALSELAASQACVVERDGRAVTYAIEDSIFSEPTQRLSRMRQERVAGA
ncbi:MAG TPA: helix-turn-helix transcriptional regulator [Polyangia bacterium]|nr:helix-turn-helix transcriptional regulator [Polyangia bacterium]